MRKILLVGHRKARTEFVSLQLQLEKQDRRLCLCVDWRKAASFSLLFSGEVCGRGFRLDSCTNFWQSVTKIGHHLKKKHCRYTRQVSSTDENADTPRRIFYRSVEIKGEW